MLSSLAWISQQVSIYFGIPLLVAGLCGGFLNAIVFLSLETFRRSSCAFYLLVMSIVNIGQLFTGLLTRIMITGFSVDWTLTSPFYCKFRYFIFQTCTLISLTCSCMATIDQYLATCSRPRWHRWSHLRLAHRLTCVSTIVWSLHGVLYLLLVAIRNAVCSIVNASFVQYHIYGYLFVLTGLLPILLTSCFGLLAYQNVRTLNYRSIPLVRHELEKQLTVMVLTQVIPNVLTLLPYTITNVLGLNLSVSGDPVLARRMLFAQELSIFVYYVNFAVRIEGETKACRSFLSRRSRARFISTCASRNGSVDN